jgi:uncharacterized protein YdaU (DUF1376 family)
MGAGWMSAAWIKFYPSDWLSGTRGLNAAETGVYITLIALMYEREAPVPNEPKRLARQIGMTTAAFEKVIDELLRQGKIRLAEEGFWKDRVAKEIKNREEKSEVAKTSANTRWEKAKQKQKSSDANASETHCEDDATRYQIPEERDKSLSSAEVVKEILTIIPKTKARMAPKKTLPKAVKAILAKTPPESLLAAVRACYTHPDSTREDGQYAPAIYKFLITGMWENWIAADSATAAAEMTDDEWRRLLLTWHDSRAWPPYAGPIPGQENCRVPEEILARYRSWAAEKLKDQAA